MFAKSLFRVQSERQSILIVGGGIGGLALAVAARGLNADVTIWERAAELREVGAGLLLTANAMWVPKQLGLAEAAIRAGHLVHAWQILDRRGQVLQTFARNGEAPMSISIARSAFQETLRREIPPEALLLGREMVGLDQPSAGEALRVRAADGTTRHADVVVGADGGRSQVRRAVFGDGKLRECGYVGWRALVDYVPDGWRDGRITESWGEGCRFGISPISANRCYWYATENAPAGWTLPASERRSHLLGRFRHWHRPVRELIEATPTEQILLNSIADHPRLPRWCRGRVALLGDAAHLMTPNLGQGAAMALEDAWVLAESFRQFGCTEAALESYEERRRWRAGYVVWQSRQVGHLIQLEHRWLTHLRDASLRCTPDFLGMLATAPVFYFRG